MAFADDYPPDLAIHQPKVFTQREFDAAVAAAREEQAEESFTMGIWKGQREVDHLAELLVLGTKARAAGIQEARDAVAAWNCGWPDDSSQHTGCPCAKEALAAIDALEKP